MGNFTCLNQDEGIEYHVLLIGPSGSGKTKLLSQKATGPTIKLERHIIKVNDHSYLSVIDTPGIMNLFKQQVNAETLSQIDLVAYFDCSDQYKAHVQEIIDQGSKLQKTIAWYNIKEEGLKDDAFQKILNFIITQTKRKSKKPSYLQEVK
ncbi:hypothetical protein pb186bvf_010369 [Paramecium bursaria]